MDLEAEAVVVGSGPGGATVARALARAGWRVLLCEQGEDWRGRRTYGTHAGALRYTDRGGLWFSHEGVQIVRPLLLGGATGQFAGCAARPPDWLRTRYGLDLTAEVEETLAELAVAPLPPDQRGAASTRLAQAGQALGYRWQPMPKLLRPARARRFACGAHCLLGCRCGAKWSAAEFVDQAVAAGARLLTGARVERLLRRDRQVVGVAGRRRGQPFTVRAETVVLAAGGLGTPPLLRAAGLARAGEGLALDTTLVVYGLGPGPGNALEPPMTWFWEDPAAGVMISPLVDPWLLYPVVAGLADGRAILTWPRWRRLLGLMIKIKDTVSGRLLPDGRVSKPLTPDDRERLAYGLAIARQTLIEAGAAPASLVLTPLRGTHPAATVRLGDLVDADLQTPVRGLFVCDASVFPEALGRPTVVTIIALAKRLARRLTGRPAPAD